MKLSIHKRKPPSALRVASALVLGLFGSSALAQVSQDQLVSGGGKASGSSPSVSWSALGEPMGGRMSGGGFVILGGGQPPSGNSPPRILDFTPADKSRFYKGAVVTLSVTATDSDNDPLECRFLVDGVVLQDWSASTTATWDTTSPSFGWHFLRVEVRDGTDTSSKEHRAFLFWRPPSP